jgi:hypothetical protein
VENRSDTLSSSASNSNSQPPAVWICVLVFMCSSLTLGTVASLAEVQSDSSETRASRPVRVGEGESASIVLTPMPAKYQFQGGAILDLFTASADSVLWFGPNAPNPHSWLGVSIVCRSTCSFDVIYSPVAGASADSIHFEGVEPSAYQVRVDRNGGSGPREFGLQFLYLGEVVGEIPRIVHAR